MPVSYTHLFSVDFMIDFDYEKKDYNRRIDIRNVRSIKIGGAESCAIEIRDEYLGKDTITLKRVEDALTVVDEGCRYGVFVNGKRVSGEKKLNNLDFISIVGYSFYYKEEKLYTTTKENLRVHGLEEMILHGQETVFPVSYTHLDVYKRQHFRLKRHSSFVEILHLQRQMEKAM